MQETRARWRTARAPQYCRKNTALLLVIFFTVMWTCTARAFASTEGNKKRNSITTFTCENSTLSIQCQEGETINILRAGYGRYSILVCNDNGFTDLNVQCQYDLSMRVVAERCNRKSNCSIPITNSVFGDPCPDTPKYIEVHYECMIAARTSTTSRPSPPWLMSSQPSVWSMAKLPSLTPQKVPVNPGNVGAELTTLTSPMQSMTTTTTTPMPRQHQPQPLPEPSPTSINSAAGGDEDSDFKDIEESSLAPVDPTMPTPSTTPMAISKTSRRPTAPSTSGFEFKPSPSKSWVQENDLTQHCGPVTARNLNWNYTQLGETAIQACPGGAVGQARWYCGLNESAAVLGMGSATWQPATPNLSNCRSVWLTSLESRIDEKGTALLAIAEELDKVIRSDKMLYGGDMMTTTKIIKKLAQKFRNDIHTYPNPKQLTALATDLMKTAVLTSSNLLDISQQATWRDLSYREQMEVATSLLVGLEDNAFLLADTVNVEQTVTMMEKNILLSVRVVKTQNIGTEQFPTDEVWKQWNSSQDWLQLPRGALLENSEKGLVRLVFVVFDRLEEILQPLSDSNSAAIISSRENEEVVGSSLKDKHSNTRILNSKIISASLSKGRHIQLSEPVRLCLRHLRMENVSNPSCVFWDYSSSAWSDDGCKVESTNRTHTICQCNHLTNFAVLMDVHATLIAPVHQTALQIITYVGCIISIVCLILAIITFQLFRGLKSDRTTIHKNLCFCLLVAEILFLAGIGQTDKPVICGVVAGFLHFFFLCAFAWMFLEGFQLYVMLIEVFEAEKPRIRWYYIFAYGAPLIIVAVSCVVDPFSYGTEKYCWLRADNFFIFSFVGPVILVILANLVFLSMAIYKMCRHTSSSVPVKSKEHARLASARGKEENAHSNRIQSNLAWLRGAIVLVFLLGLTWTFGLLYLNEESVIMAYIFTVLNSLQGLFIFVFHCVQNEKVHKEYVKFIWRNSWLPKCLRCSKPSTGKEQSSSFYAGSNGNPSAPNSHSTDSSGLSPHGTSYILQRGWSGRTSSRAKPSLALSRASHRASSRAPPTSNPSEQEVEKISFKSYSRDSGHGGSEQEDSPRSFNTTTLSSLNNLRCLNNSKDARRPSFMPPDYHQGITNDLSTTSEGHHRVMLDPHCGLELCQRGETGTLTRAQLQEQQQQQEEAAMQQQQQQLGLMPQEMRQLAAAPPHLLPQLLHHQLAVAAHHHYTGQIPHGRVPKKINASLLRSASPWNHTYTEIRDGHMHPNLVHLRPPSEDDPVYEEIERNEIQVSDMSDEEVKRQSDMSRQSSRSYSDHRPLIPCNPGAERSIQHNLDSLLRHKLKEQRYQAATSPGATAAALAAMHSQEEDEILECALPRVVAAAAAAEAHYRCQQLGSPRHNTKPNPYLFPSDNVRTVAFLEGDTVVCHLQPEHELYAHNPYSTRTMVFSPYSEC